LTLTLTVSSTSIGQNFKKDLERGLYSTSPDWVFVLQLVSDSLKGFKLIESRQHYDQVALVLFDSIPKRQIFTPRRSRRNREKIDDILKVKDGHFAVIYEIDSGFNTYNFVRRGIGYEMYFADYKVEKKELNKSILSDTTNYFIFYEFTLDDLKELKKLKNLNDISESEFNDLMTFIEEEKTKYQRQLANSKSKSLYGTIESNQILTKILLEKQFNPIIMPGDFDKIYKKYRPKR